MTAGVALAAAMDTAAVAAASATGAVASALNGRASVEWQSQRHRQGQGADTGAMSWTGRRGACEHAEVRDIDADIVAVAAAAAAVPLSRCMADLIVALWSGG